MAGSRPVGAHLRMRWRTPLLIVPTLVVLMLTMNPSLAAACLVRVYGRRRRP